MAAMAVDAPTDAGAAASGSSQPLSMPSRNPIPLSATQEAQVRDVFYSRVRAKCSDEIKAFAECALGRTFTVTFACRGPNRAMNACMKEHATPAEQDAAREEWFAGRLERQRERERKTRRKLEQEKFMREWWGMPEMDKERVRREMEKLQREERIGGFASKDRPRFDLPPPSQQPGGKDSS